MIWITSEKMKQKKNSLYLLSRDMVLNDIKIRYKTIDISMG